MKIVWIPEAPNHPGLYANESGTDIRSEGKISTGELQPSTHSWEHARQFASEAECQSWCEVNPTLAFVPREHGIMDALTPAQVAAFNGFVNAKPLPQ